MAEVRIDGVLYVPVSESNPNAAAIIDALVSQWWGKGWQQKAPDAPSYLRVLVGDSIDEGEGESVTEFVGRLLAGTTEGQSDG